MIRIIQRILDKKVVVEYIEGRSVDVPANVLDVTKYKMTFGVNKFISLEKGIALTMNYLKKDWIYADER